MRSRMHEGCVDGSLGDRILNLGMNREKAMTTTFNAATTKTVSVNGTNFVYREIGDKSGVPVVFLHHLTAVLEDWDPAIADGLAKSHPVIAFDNRGVGGSEGKTPDTVADMAKDAIAFIDALGLAKVDLFGFSLGGFIAQVVAQERPDLVRRIILAGTAPAGGEGIVNVGAVLQDAIAKAAAENKHPKHLLFFRPSKDSQKAADAFLSRLSERKEDRDAAVTNEAIHAQVTAITKWGMAATGSLGTIRQPVLVVNGDNDIMAPTINSVELTRKPPNAELSIFPDAGHGAIFQYHDVFVDQALRFLQD
jgi:pimeloyl-ACP methyl ester carboxylesterase